MAQTRYVILLIKQAWKAHLSSARPLSQTEARGEILPARSSVEIGGKGGGAQFRSGPLLPLKMHTTLRACAMHDTMERTR